MSSGGQSPPGIMEGGAPPSLGIMFFRSPLVHFLFRDLFDANMPEDNIDPLPPLSNRAIQKKIAMVGQELYRCPQKGLLPPSESADTVGVAKA